MIRQFQYYLVRLELALLSAKNGVRNQNGISNHYQKTFF